MGQLTADQVPRPDAGPAVAGKCISRCLWPDMVQFGRFAPSSISTSTRDRLEFFSRRIKAAMVHDRSKTDLGIVGVELCRVSEAAIAK